MIPLMIMLTIDPIFPAAIETTLNTTLIIDKITVTVQAHPRSFSSPYATTKEAIAIARSTAPIAMPIPPNIDGETVVVTTEGGIVDVCPEVRLPCSC